MYDFELTEDVNNNDYQLMFKQDGQMVNIVWFDRVNIDGNGRVSLYLADRNVAIVNVLNHQALNNVLTSLANKNQVD
ncbi:MAG: hypothetical protein ACK5NC_11920 [Vibrio sp.]